MAPYKVTKQTKDGKLTTICKNDLELITLVHLYQHLNDEKLTYNLNECLEYLDEVHSLANELQSIAA